MRLRYYISSTDNELYGGRHRLGSRYMTFGQHSYILDLVRCLQRNNCDVDMIIDGAASFSVGPLLKGCCQIIEAGDEHTCGSEVSGVLLDVLSDAMLTTVPRNIPSACIVHNAGAKFSSEMCSRVDRFICMTPNAVRIQSSIVGADRVEFIPQGVDLSRFNVSAQSSKAPPETAARVLWYTRLNSEKRLTLLTTIEKLLETGVELCVLGDGEVFWEISDQFGDRIALVNFAPCQSIQHFLRRFDVVISSGRGVMESLSCGVPAICAGFGYGGVVSDENVSELMHYNLTGWRSIRSINSIRDDVEKARRIPSSECRSLAERYFDGDQMARSVRDLVLRLANSDV